MKVIIAGAGIGGLCLAQGLKRAGIEIALYERDAGPQQRKQGYRLHLDGDGITALRACLDPASFTLLEATSMAPLPYTTILDTGFAIQRRFKADDYGKTEHHRTAGIATHWNVNRATLREILLHGLAECCNWGRRVTGYAEDGHGVTVTFADGSSDRGDVLVGADGAGSAIARQRAPQAAIMDTGVRAIYGRVPWRAAQTVLPEHCLADIFTACADDRKFILGVGPVRYPMRPDRAARQLLPDAGLAAQDDYVGCIVSGRQTLFGEDDALRTMDSDGLQALAGQMLEEWPAMASAVPAAGEPGSFFFVEMTSSVPFALNRAGRTTLLGDAIHVMTPSLGRGANVALHDAALLVRHLASASKGQAALQMALADYETTMARYGFDVVRESAAMGTRLLGQAPLP